YSKAYSEGHPIRSNTLLSSTPSRTAQKHSRRVILDVVYNHLGPDGCVFARYAKEYYSKAYSNEWGDPLNFAGPDSGPVRDYFASNAAYWIDEFRLDGLRLDATQTIYDRSSPHMITEIGCRARSAAKGRSIILVAESETQTVRLVRPIEA